MPSPTRLTLRLIAAIALAVLFSGVPAVQARSVYLPGFPLLRQQHSLTCESSAASMGTHGRVTEDQIMAAMPRNPNPNVGFRGNPDGQQGNALVDYGVYAAPIQKALLRYGFRSDLLMYSTPQQLKSYIDRGWPVLTWVTYALQYAKPRIGWAFGEPFFLVPHEHAVLMVGYDNNIVAANDPWVAKMVRYSWKDFRRAWGYFQNMALAIEPCQEPPPVSGLMVSALSANGITWSWSPARFASSYQVQVVRYVKNTTTVLFQGSVKTTQFTLDKPSPKASYELSVQSISACNTASSAVRLYAQAPSSLYAPTGTPTSLTPITTPSPEGTPVPGSATVTPTSTAGSAPGPGATVAPTR